MLEQQKTPQDVVAVFVRQGRQEAEDLVRCLDVWLLGKKVTG